MSKFPGDKGYQAFRILQVVFVGAPILSGLDKFFNFFVEWAVYLSPSVMNVIHGQDPLLLGVAGVIEIIAGIGMIFKPKIFAYIISGWLALIVVMLLQTGNFYDIALRDLGLCLSAFAFGKLSQKYTQ